MVRPVELQDTLAKTPAVERIAQQQKANSENEQRQAIQNAGQKADDDQHKADPAHHSDEAILHRERDKKDDRKKRRPDDAKESRDAATPHGTTDAAGDADELPPPDLDITV